MHPRLCLRWSQGHQKKGGAWGKSWAFPSTLPQTEPGPPGSSVASCWPDAPCGGGGGGGLGRLPLLSALCKTLVVYFYNKRSYYLNLLHTAELRLTVVPPSGEPPLPCHSTRA